MISYPRLNENAARDLLSELTPLDVEELKRRSDTTHPQSDWYPTASHRVTAGRLADLRESIRSIAEDYGYPHAMGIRSAKYRLFDQRVSVELLDRMDIVPADAAHEGVWSFLSLVLLPDVSLWRFPNRQEKDDYERILGKPRNVFRRLWWRSYILGTTAGEGLLEDEAVAILERPSIGGDPRLAAEIARQHLKTIGNDKRLSRTELLREAAKRVRRRNAVVTFPALTDTGLSATISEIFEESASALLDSGVSGE
ncbi:hypothetical protein [Saccharomonospora iraqiensis]|uniref:hypothetical protein n=1 Tax=Saccharomonospora iraqiensis TaxID=52698 RepID=UPI00022DF484|nr:hypothetical protein [Saccharomonospora iraqiensis]